jgi:hypothetical protein
VGESIKEECLKYFVTKETFYSLLKYLIPIIAFFMTGACAFALNELKDRNTIKCDVSSLQRRQEFMSDTVINQLTRQAAVYAQLNSKLDKLLEK